MDIKQRVLGGLYEYAMSKAKVYFGTGNQILAERFLNTANILSPTMVGTSYAGHANVPAPIPTGSTEPGGAGTQHQTDCQ